MSGVEIEIETKVRIPMWMDVTRGGGEGERLRRLLYTACQNDSEAVAEA